MRLPLRRVERPLHLALGLRLRSLCLFFLKRFHPPHQIGDVRVRAAETEPLERLLQEVQVLRVLAALATADADDLRDGLGIALGGVTQELGICGKADVDHTRYVGRMRGRRV